MSGLLFAESHLILLVSDEQGLLDATAGRIEGVAGAFPALLTQVRVGIHRYREV